MEQMTAIRYLAYCILVPMAVLACSGASQFSPVNVSSGNMAIKGYDPVAYFTEQRPVAGNPSFEYLWNGATWRFASAEHRDLFQSDPEKYSPKYGGYCAYAVSQGKIADIDPEAWTVFEGRLYLNLNKDVQRLWERSKDDYILKADENWPRLLGQKKRF